MPKSTVSPTVARKLRERMEQPGGLNLRREQEGEREAFPMTRVWTPRPGGPESFGPPQPDPRPPAEQMDAATQNWRDNVYRAQFKNPAIEDEFVNKVMGMQGETLPEGAMGWDYNGQAVFSYDRGQDAWKKFEYNINGKVDVSDDAVQQVKADLEANKKGYWWLNLNPLGQFAYALLQGENRMKDAAQKLQGGEDEANWLTKATRVPGELFNLALSGLQTKLTEDVIQKNIAGVVRATEAAADESSLPDVFEGMDEQIRQYVRESPGLISGLPEGVKDFYSGILNLARRPVDAAWEVVRATEATLTGKFTREEAEAARDAGYIGGAMMWTRATDYAVAAEYDRRVAEGANPELVMRELTNPWAEGVGQMFVDFDLLFKIPELAGKLRGVKNMLEKYPQLGAAVNKLVRFGKAPLVQDTEIKTLMKLPEEITEALKAVSAVENPVHAERVTEPLVEALVTAFNRLDTDIAKAEQSIEALIDKRGLLDPIASAKQATSGRRIKRVLSQLAYDARENPAQLGESLIALHRLSSQSLTDKRAALETIARMPFARTLLTEDGLYSAALLRRFIGDDSTKFIKGLNEASKTGGDAVLKFLDTRIDNALDATFPTLTERISAWEKLNKTRPARTDQIPNPFPTWQIWLDKVHQRAQNTVFKRAAAFMNTFFLRLNPSYATRNMIQNQFSIAVDYGIEAATRSRKASEKIIDGYGVVFKPTGFSGGTMGVESTTKLPTLADMANYAGKAEENGAMAVAATAIRDAMEKMLTPGAAIPPVDDMVRAGLPQQAADLLSNLLHKFKGDVDAAATEFYRAAKAGAIDVVESGQWISREQYDILLSSGLHNPGRFLDEIADIRKRGGTLEEAGRVFDRAVEEVAQQSRALEPIMPALGDADFEDAAKIMAAIEDGDFTDIIREQDVLKLNWYGAANKGYKNSVFMLLTDLMRETSVNQKLAGLTPILENMMHSLRGVSEKFGAAAQDITDSVVSLNKQALLNKDPDWFVQQWGLLNWKTLDGVPSGPAPTTSAEFRKRLWEEFFYPAKRKIWQADRVQFANILNAGLVQNPKFAGVANTSAFNVTKRYERLAELWDGVTVDQAYLTALAKEIARGDIEGKRNAARLIANAFGMPSEMGTVSRDLTRARDDLGRVLRKDNQILAVINKYRRAGLPEFKDLGDVPVDDVRYAFQNKLYKEAGLEEAFGAYKHIRSNPETYNTIVTAPLQSLPVNIYERVRQEADTLWRELKDGRSGFRQFFDRNDVGGEPGVIGIGSTNVKWYREAYEDGMTSKEEFVKAANYLADPKGKEPKNKYYKFLREMIAKRIYNGYSDFTGGLVPPDVRTLLAIGDEAEALASAKYFREDLKKVGHAAEEIERRLAESVGDYYNRLLELERLQAAGIPVRTVNADSVAEVVKQMTGEVDTVELSRWDKAQAEIGKQMAGQVDEAADAAKIANETPGIPPPLARDPLSDDIPTAAENAIESLDGIKNMAGNLKDTLAQRWGETQRVVVDSAQNNTITRAIEAWLEEARGRVAVAKNIAASTAEKARKWTLLAYDEKYGADLVANYLFPYQFWYSRSYKNWMMRAMSNPKLAMSYHRYRESLQQEHAGYPDWWKYNVSTRDLGKIFGMNVESPLYFNLEALLNPINGLTGVDFNDPEKRINTWTSLLDDMGKFGPSLHPLVNIGVATALFAQGELDASSRWAGRMIPQTLYAKNLANLAGVNIPTMRGVNEIDPFVLAFSQGQDPYEERRVARELGIMQAEGLVDAETAIDEAWTPEKSELWRTATERAISRRSQNPFLYLINMLGGVGLKARTPEDMQIDLFDAEWRRVWALKDTLTPQEFQYALDDLRYKFPWGDTVILARKSGDARDRAYAYNVLGRIPPGLSRELLDLVDVNQDEVSAFYDNKGDLSSMAPNDRERFMLGVADLGAVLELPPWATRTEWNDARALYKDIDKDMQGVFGTDILAMITYFFSLKGDEKRQDEFMAANPQVQEALKYKDGRIMAHPLLSHYYASIEKAQNYQTSLMYDDLNAKFPGVADLWQEYRDMALTDTKAANAFKKAHPEMDAYNKLRDAWDKRIAKYMVDFAENVNPNGPGLRSVEPQSNRQEAVMDYVNQLPDVGQYGQNADALMNGMSAALKNVVLDFVYNGEEPSYSAIQSIDRIAKKAGMDAETYLELLKKLILSE